MPKFRIRYSKATKRFTASKVKVDKSYDFMKCIIKESYLRALDSEKRTKEEVDSRKRQHFVAPEERPGRHITIEDRVKCSRMK